MSFQYPEVNVREKAALIAAWMNYHDEEFNSRVKTLRDAEKLYDRAMRGDVPEMADEWEPKLLVETIGYNPWNR